MIKEILCTGESNAQTGKELCRILGIKERTLTIAIEAERRAGAPICASTNAATPGYFLAEDKEEMERYCSSLERRAQEIGKTRRACMRTLKSLPTRSK